MSRPVSRYALGLWFCGIAALGLLRFWAKVRESGTPLPFDAWLWLIGSLICALIGVIALLRTRRP
ncbi:hypothetical protein IP90_02782 [Luteimonas cucumeris]|uniref:Uncharacterized protein n=1 Tax=Luteimonas cucumeris TaxID=985012 RepID=A0A562KY97_9GAMM|nr:hypothetical protein [Luteimonas cucumeris]TWI00236.1 hypothetical protein IP90_02782 [Luteimonas cucumeris]